jgi:hypothetical protein
MYSSRSRDLHRTLLVCASLNNDMFRNDASKMKFIPAQSSKAGNASAHIRSGDGLLVVVVLAKYRHRSLIVATFSSSVGSARYLQEYQEWIEHQLGSVHQDL